MIKTGFCVSYDWELLKTSLPRVYEASDIICLAVDKNRMTWGMKPFDFDEEALGVGARYYHHLAKVAGTRLRESYGRS